MAAAFRVALRTIYASVGASELLELRQGKRFAEVDKWASETFKISCRGCILHTKGLRVL